jgi:hypothetical protein
MFALKGAMFMLLAFNNRPHVENICSPGTLDEETDK